MNKAEERACQYTGYCKNQSYSDFLNGYHQAEKDLTDKAKTSSGWDGFFYGQGYKQAEKDNELTWEDLATIEKISDDFVKHNQTPMGDEEFYKEVLKRFNKERKEKFKI